MSAEFIYGFALAAGLDIPEAREQWDGFSREIGDAERAEIERQGSDSGFAEGNKWRKMFATVCAQGTVDDDMQAVVRVEFID